MSNLASLSFLYMFKLFGVKMCAFWCLEYLFISSEYSLMSDMPFISYLKFQIMICDILECPSGPGLDFWVKFDSVIMIHNVEPLKYQRYSI
jgi:hypothetical protein